MLVRTYLSLGRMKENNKDIKKTSPTTTTQQAAAQIMRNTSTVSVSARAKLMIIIYHGQWYIPTLATTKGASANYKVTFQNSILVHSTAPKSCLLTVNGIEEFFHLHVQCTRFKFSYKNTQQRKAINRSYSLLNLELNYGVSYRDQNSQTYQNMESCRNRLISKNIT